MSRKTTALDYKLPQTVEYIQQGWLSTCQSSAAISGFLTVTATLLLLFLKNTANFDGSRQNSHGMLIALELLSYASIFLNISSCMSCFILLDRLGDVPYKSSRDPDVPIGGRTTLEQEGVMRTYGIGALWQWVFWHWLFCFITGAWSILAQILIYIWLQESSQTQIGLSVIGAFSILPFAAYILAPMFNAWKGRNKDADVESNSPRTSHRTSTLDQLPSPVIPPASPIMSSMYTRERQISTVASLKGPMYR
ncbi:hypothetical protein BJ912DRAFT_945049 [Pholiota molesta]|nr:hypothetical protein BJ912DRAFT_945049 [Pholiota molesta]